MCQITDPQEPGSGDTWASRSRNVSEGFKNLVEMKGVG